MGGACWAGVGFEIGIEFVSRESFDSFESLELEPLPVGLFGALKENVRLDFNGTNLGDLLVGLEERGFVVGLVGVVTWAGGVVIVTGDVVWAGICSLGISASGTRGERA